MYFYYCILCREWVLLNNLLVRTDAMRWMVILCAWRFIHSEPWINGNGRHHGTGHTHCRCAFELLKRFFHHFFFSSIRFPLMPEKREWGRVRVMCSGAEVPTLTRPFVNWISWMLMALLRVRVLKKWNTHSRARSTIFGSPSVSTRLFRVYLFIILFQFTYSFRAIEVLQIHGGKREDTKNRKEWKFQFRLTHS